MMSDARILANVVRCMAHTFTAPRSRRELAAKLRTIRNTSGRKVATLALAELSSQWITNYVK